MNEIRKLMEAIEKIEENYYGGGHLSTDVRQATNRIHEMMDEGILDPRAIADAALNYMSEADVADMARAEELFPYDDDDIEENVELIGDPDQRTYSVANAEAELALTRTAQALAKDAVEQAAGVYDEEGPGEGKFATGAKNRHQYVHIAAPKFLDGEYSRSIIAYLKEKFDAAVKQELHNYDENRP